MKSVKLGSIAPPKEMLTQKEVASALGVHYRTVQRMIQRGDLKAVRIGRAYYVGMDSIGRYLRKGE